ncbi:hypothetical protein DN594_00075, partial [Enterobacter cloacae]
PETAWLLASTKRVNKILVFFTRLTAQKMYFAYVLVRLAFNPLNRHFMKLPCSCIGNNVRNRVRLENGIYGHSRFCNTDFDDKLACLNLSGV